MGAQKVKNIARPVRVYKVVDCLAAPAHSLRPPGRLRLASVRVVGVAACLIVVALVTVWWRPWEAAIEPAAIERMAHALPERPSLAVLPFANMSDDPAQQHFADGISEDLITDLSQINELFVIARNSTFVYRNQSVSIRRVAEDLGVHYVLEGSVRRDGAKLRVNAQLIDALTGGHVWAERYDGVATDVLAVQDMFVREIVKALKVNLTAEESDEIALGHTANLSAREIFQRGWENFLRYTPEANATAAAQLKQAVEIDPEYGRAYAALGLTYLRGCQMRWNEPLGMSVDGANSTALMYLEKTREWPSSLANVAASRIELYNNRYDAALTEATRAISTDPNDPEAYIAMAWAMITTGKPEAGLEFVTVAMRLNPTYPSYYVFPQATAHYAMGDIKRTAGILAEAVARDTGAIELLPLLAAAYAQTGERRMARETILMWRPGASQQELDRALPSYHFPYEWSDGHEVLKRLGDGLKLAALPLQTTVRSLIDDLSAQNASDRAAAAATLGLFGPQAVEAVPALITALADGKLFVRRATAIALGMIGPPASAAIPALKAIQDERIVGLYATEAIRRIDIQ
jgi:TolB-like protein/thioredoxin-like negative regulator of GroEL